MNNITNNFTGKSFKITNEYLHLFIAIILGFLTFFGLNPIGGLTNEGIKLLSIIIPTIYMWLFVNTHWVSLLFLGMLVTTGIMSANEVWAASLGHFAIMLVLTFSILSQCLQENGIIEKIAFWFITRKCNIGRPYIFMAMFFASNLIIGLFMQNLALAVIYVSLTEQICKTLGIEKGHSLYNCLMLGTFWGNGVLSIASPIAKTLPNILIGLVYTNYGINISYAEWLMVGIPFSILMFGVIILVIKLADPDTTALKNLNIQSLGIKQKPLNKKAKIGCMVMIFLLVFILIPEIFLLIGIFESFSSHLVSLGVIVPAIFAVAILSIIKVKEKNNFSPVLDFTEISKKIPINLLLFVSAVVIMGVPMARQETGIISWIDYLLNPLIYTYSPIMLVIILSVLAVIFTNFISNTVVITVFVSLGFAIFTQTTVHPVMFAVLIAFAASITCLTPSATITAPLYFGPGHLKVVKVLKINILFLILATSVLLSLIPLIQWVLV